MKFYGSSNEGKVFLKDRDRLLKYLTSLDGDFVVKITPTKDIRTLQANDLYWWWMTLLSEHSGNSKRELHNYFKTQLLCLEGEVNGKRVIDCHSTTDLTIKEFSDYLLNVGRLAIEDFNFYLPSQDSLLSYNP